jgi:hypothetical protein
MAGEKMFNGWFNAPAGSELVIAATGTTKNKFVLATLDGVVTSKTGAAERKISGILNTAIATEERIPLKASKIYVIDVDLTFITDADAVVEAQVELSGGGLFGKKFRTPISRKKDSVEAVTLFVSVLP